LYGSFLLFSSELITYLLPDNFFVGIGDINEPGKAPAQSQEALSAPMEGQEQTLAEPEVASTPKPLPKSEARRESIHIEQDIELERVQKILKKTHDSFYENRSEPEKGVADVRVILPEMRKTILSGVRLVFSGVIPLGNDPTKYDFSPFSIRNRKLIAVLDVIEMNTGKLQMLLEQIFQTLWTRKQHM
jgi:RNA polymerase II subunit A-like phosphatase